MAKLVSPLDSLSLMQPHTDFKESLLECRCSLAISLRCCCCIEYRVRLDLFRLDRRLSVCLSHDDYCLKYVRSQTIYWLLGRRTKRCVLHLEWLVPYSR